MPKLAGARQRVKLMSHQIEILKKICCDSEGATGCSVSLGRAAALLRLGMVQLVPTKEAVAYLTGEQILSPRQVEQWIHGMRAHGVKPAPQEKRKTRKQLDLEANIQRAEEADQRWREEQKAKNNP